MGILIDRVGKRYNRLLVIAYGGKKRNKHVWKCICDCGKEITVPGGALQTGNTNSCGCYQKDRIREVGFIDLTGKRFGRWVVVEYAGRGYNNKMQMWICVCDCGTKRKVSGCNLVTSISTSCGCVNIENKTKHGLCKKLSNVEYRNFLWKEKPERKVKHYVSKSIRESLKKRKRRKNGITFDHLPYTMVELKEHLEKQFEPWMSWDNYGTAWHIDHIVQHNLFDYKSMDDPAFAECWALSNLRPLEKHANLSRPKSG